MKCLGKGQSDQQQSQEEGCGCKEGRCLVTPRRTKDTIRTSDHETTKPQRAERQKTSRWWRWLRPEKGVGLKRPRVMARTTNKVPSKGQSDRQWKLLRRRETPRHTMTCQEHRSDKWLQNNRATNAKARKQRRKAARWWRWQRPKKEEAWSDRGPRQGQNKASSKIGEALQHAKAPNQVKRRAPIL